MKKFVLVTVVMAGALAIASCKKDRTCSCDVVSTGLLEASFTADTVFTDISKKDAETKCEAQNSTVEAFGTKVVTTCELK